MARPDDPLRLQAPADCSESRLRAFEAVVRRAFDGSDESLPERIRSAKRLAFHYQTDGELTAIAALKCPSETYRGDLFVRAGSRADAYVFELELGWVFVAPRQRGARIGELLCRRLLESAPGSRVFATTRPDNRAMIRILRALGLAPTGGSFRHRRRDEQLLLFIDRRDADNR